VLPKLPTQHINLYGAEQNRSESHQTLVALLRSAFSQGQNKRSIAA
jgi:hypothetical protein